MDKKAKFENFLESLKGHKQDGLIESIKKGFLVCFESTTQLTKWFGKSKIVDKQGNPLKVYHNGYFDKTSHKIPNISSEGMHFGTQEAARERAYVKFIDDCYEDIKIEQDKHGKYHWKMKGYSSYDVDKEGWYSEEEAEMNAEEKARELGDDYAGEGFHITTAYLKIENPKYIPDQKNNWKNEIDTAKQQGYDGIIYKNKVEDSGSTSFVVFHPKQIKIIN